MHNRSRPRAGPASAHSPPLATSPPPPATAAIAPAAHSAPGPLAEPIPTTPRHQRLLLHSPATRTAHLRPRRHHLRHRCHRPSHIPSSHHLLRCATDSSSTAPLTAQVILVVVARSRPAPPPRRRWPIHQIRREQLGNQAIMAQPPEPACPTDQADQAVFPQLPASPPNRAAQAYSLLLSPKPLPLPAFYLLALSLLDLASSRAPATVRGSGPVLRKGGGPTRRAPTPPLPCRPAPSVAPNRSQTETAASQLVSEITPPPTSPLTSPHTREINRQS